MTLTLAELNIRDIRAQLPRADWIIGLRDGTTSITVHYNGPPLPPERQRGDGLIAQLQGDARYHMTPGWGGTVNGSPHIAYHYCVASDGVIYQLCSDREILWHCGHQDGNSHGLAIHFPLGGDQDATAIQWSRGLQLIDALCLFYNVPRARVFGHLEWKHATACPGQLQPHVEAYRGAAQPPAPTIVPGLRQFQISPNLAASARVRQGPGVSFPIAGHMKPGTILFVDVVKNGDTVDGNPHWVHMARVPNEQADLGFISETLGVWL